jgi:hypothetical protein
MRAPLLWRMLGALLVLSAAISAQAVTVSLGAFAFDSSKFGDTLVESDSSSSSTFRARNWLNVVNTDPGNPGALTGANFDTGIANIGLRELIPPTYTIGYNGGILNGAGADLGVIVARFSTDEFVISFDGGVGFYVSGDAAVNTSVNRNYFYRGCGIDCGSFNATLFVHMLDLSDYGVASGASISSVSITSDQQLDLIRVAGVIPEPSTGLLVIAGLLGFASWRRGRV